MAQAQSQQHKLYKFLRDGTPTAIALFLSKNPEAFLAFLGLENTRQVQKLIDLLNSTDQKELQRALNLIDASLDKRKEHLSRFFVNKNKRVIPAPITPDPAPIVPPAKGSSKAEYRENLALAVSSAGRLLRNLNPWNLKPYEALRDSVRLLTECMAATLSIAAMNKTERLIVEGAIILPAYAMLSAKAAGNITGLVMGFSMATGEAEAALPPPALEPIRQELSGTVSGPLELIITRPPTATSDRLNSDFSTANFNGLPYLSYNGEKKVSFRGWQMSPHVASATLNSAEIVGIPPNFLFSMIGPESSFNTNSFNKDTKACGLGQFIPSTLYEKVYNYGTLIGYPQVQNLVERYVVRRDEQKRPFYGFKPKSEEAAAQIRTACMDPEFNTRLNSVYVARNIGRMQVSLKEYAPSNYQYYPVNATQTYLAHFAGINRAMRMIKNMHEDKGQAIAHMYFDRAATKANLNYLFVNGQQDSPRTVKEFLEFLQHDKKLGDSIMPDMRNWSDIAETIAVNVAIFANGNPKPRPTP